jgi:hypothetical protein
MASMPYKPEKRFDDSREEKGSEVLSSVKEKKDPSILLVIE